MNDDIVIEETKIVYSYNSRDGLYIGEVLLDKTDMSPSGRWNIPAFCTEIQPIESKDGYDIYFKTDSNEWYYKEKAKTDTQEKTLDELKADKIYSLKQTRKTLEESPIEYNGKQIDYDTVSQARIELVSELLESKVSLGETNNDIQWTMTDNNDQQLTLEDFKQIRLLAAQRVITLHNKYNEAKQLVEQATNKEELKDITITL